MSVTAPPSPGHVAAACKLDALSKQLEDMLLDNDPRSLQLSAQMAFSHQNSADAIDLISRAIKLEPNVTDRHLIKGFFQLNLGQLDDAASSFQAAIALDEKDTDGHFSLGEAEFLRGNLDAAVTSYTAALTRNAQLHFVYYRRGEVYLQQKQMEKALSDFALFLEKENKVSENYADCLTLQQWITDKRTEAFKSLKKLDGLFEGHKKKALFLDIIASAEEDYEILAEEATEAINLLVTDMEYGMEDAIALWEKKNFMQVAYKIARTVRCQMDDCQLHIVRARAYIQLGKLQEALQDLKTAENTNTRNLPILTNQIKELHASMKNNELQS